MITSHSLCTMDRQEVASRKIAGFITSSSTDDKCTAEIFTTPSFAGSNVFTKYMFFRMIINDANAFSIISICDNTDYKVHSEDRVADRHII